MDTSERRRDAGRFAAAQATRHSLARLATAMARESLVPVVLKGSLLVHVYGRDPLVRTVSDVDLLVAADRFDDATRLIVGAGWRLASEESGGRERLFLGGGVPVDLHRALFPEGMFRLSADDVIARARLDVTSFGVPVLVPDPLDTFAHLVGHAAQTFLFEQRLHHPGDFAFLAAAASLSPTSIALHLQQTGLDSAARYVMALADDDFARSVIEALGPAPLKTGFAWCVRHVVPRLPHKRGPGLVPVNVLHRPMGFAARRLAGAVVRRIRIFR